jgi:hypothetical protein
MVIVNPIPGQEERNADYLLETVAGSRGRLKIVTDALRP